MAFNKNSLSMFNWTSKRDALAEGSGDEGSDRDHEVVQHALASLRIDLTEPSIQEFLQDQQVELQTVDDFKSLLIEWPIFAQRIPSEIPYGVISKIKALAIYWSKEENQDRIPENFREVLQAATEKEESNNRKSSGGGGNGRSSNSNSQITSREKTTIPFGLGVDQKIPNFSGKDNDWFWWKKRVIAPLKLWNLHEILESAQYAAENPNEDRIVFSLLVNILGQAEHFADDCNDSGHKLWKNLLQWYESDAVQHAVRCSHLAVIERLELTGEDNGNSNGNGIGMDAMMYIAHFQRCKERIQLYSDETDSFFVSKFLSGITDSNYTTTKVQLSMQGQPTWKTCINAVRTRYVQLYYGKKSSSPTKK